MVKSANKLGRHNTASKSHKHKSVKDYDRKRDKQKLNKRIKQYF